MPSLKKIFKSRSNDDKSTLVLAPQAKEVVTESQTQLKSNQEAVAARFTDSMAQLNTSIHSVSNSMVNSYIAVTDSFVLAVEEMESSFRAKIRRTIWIFAGILTAQSIFTALLVMLLI